jgi:hypothetical protein
LLLLPLPLLPGNCLHLAAFLRWKRLKLMKGKYISRGLFYLAILVVAGLVLYLSWRSQPSMGLVWFMPQWLAHWADERANDAIRTAVPLVLLGVLVGIPLAWQNRAWTRWVASWAAMTGLVSLAEFGQLFLPHRSFDPLDIAWGAAGALVGLAAVALLKGIYHLLKTQQHGSFA